MKTLRATLVLATRSVTSASLRRIVASGSGAIVACLAAAGVTPERAARAAEPQRPDAVLLSMDRLARTINRNRLDNGLRVVMNTDRSSPTVAVCVTYDVGSRDERPGQGGFAHLFEHMMFQGSRHVDKGEHFALVAGRGGTLNGTTSADSTNYYQLLPSSELRLALYLEADRMRWLDVTSEKFENQRAVVREEYRMRIDNSPYASGLLRLGELVFADFPPYGHPTIGSMEELATARFEWVQEFYAQHYAPNNAVLSIAGDFDPDRALEIVREYFGPAELREIEPFEAPGPSNAVVVQEAALEDTNANQPALLWGYRIPPVRTGAHYALELAALILADGESSRLYSAYVRAQPIFQSVAAWTGDHRGPDQLTIFGALTEKADVAGAEKVLADAVARLGEVPPTPAELTRVKNRLRHAFAFELQSNVVRATRLAEYELFYGDARLLAAELENYLAISAEDIRRAAAQFLTPERRFTVEVHPATRQDRP